MFKVFPAILQTFVDTRLTLTPSVSPNSNYVIMVCGGNCLKYFCVFLYYNHQLHRDGLIILFMYVHFNSLFSDASGNSEHSASNSIVISKKKLISPNVLQRNLYSTRTRKTYVLAKAYLISERKSSLCTNSSFLFTRIRCSEARVEVALNCPFHLPTEPFVNTNLRCYFTSMEVPTTHLLTHKASYLDGETSFQRGTLSPYRI
jgi:hypothetical protein